MDATTVVIGAGHSGLAMSHQLTERSVDHVVLERGEVANSWRNERWDSHRLLTPNRESRLPGWRYHGDALVSIQRCCPEALVDAEDIAAVVAATLADPESPLRVESGNDPLPGSL
jgi:cation diffusion facilitator CzcD-associated flavoprotein CzcO